MSQIYLLLTLCLFVISELNCNAQSVNDPATAPADKEPMSSFQAVNASIDTILQEYELLTGKVLIRDSNLAANSLPISISVPDPVPRSELVRIIEASLLLNNFALIPSQEPNTIKVININTGKNPRSEGVRLFTGASSIPSGEQVISYYMPLRYITANEALTVFQTHILPRAFTSFVPINSSQALLITENTSVIRELVALQQLIDTPPEKNETRFVQLVRADAERVADMIDKLLQNQQRQRETNLNAAAGANPNPGVPTTSTGGAETTGNPFAQLIADTRTNRILIVGRPHNVEYVAGLVHDFDLASTTGRLLEYRLRYVTASDVINVLGDVLSEGGKEGQANTSQSPQQQQQQQNRTLNLGANPNTSSTSGYGGTSSTTGTGSSSGETTLQEPNELAAPQSLVVGKTRIVADSKNNIVLILGPPESLQRVKLILDRLDERPQQVYLATVIGQLSLTNDLLYGVDFVQTYKKINSSKGIASTNVNTSGVTNFTSTPIVDPSTITNGNVLNSAVNAASSALTQVQGLTIYGSISDAVKVFVRASDSRGDFKILARPAVYTANNKLAVISSGSRIPYPGSTLSNVNTVTGSTNTASVASTVEFVDVSLRLEVIPLINSSHEVTLKVVQINDSVSGQTVISGSNVPNISSQRLTTTVTVPSGATVVLGGLIQENERKDDNGIPVLDQIPYLGTLFKTRGVSKTRDELLVFIQPVVVGNDVQTLRASLNEERRTTVGQRAFNLAHPGQPTTVPASRKSRGKD
ncbi:MAG: hypothetical protein JO076_06315 [Verrucomicrobia bacterium]|nr:hypothetical protein [Verrucomicrobiota bacterium]